jgi:hypothetical protein
MSEEDKSVDWKGYGIDQLTVEDWLRRTFGDKSADSAEERAVRLLEEAIEYAQAVARDQAKMHEFVLHMVGEVFKKPKGQPHQELGGIIVCLLAACAQQQVRLDDVARTEIDSVLAISKEDFAKRLKKKQDAGYVIEPAVARPE